MAVTAVDENKRIVRESIEKILNGGDVDAIGDLYADDFVQHGGAMGDARGREAFEEYQRGLHAAFPDFRATEELSICEGDLVASRMRYSGTHEDEFMGVPATGKRAEVTGLVLNRIEDGRIAETWTETDLLTFMRQIGAMDERAA